jgi:Lantibiotic duramycin B-like
MRFDDARRAQEIRSFELLLTATDPDYRAHLRDSRDLDHVERALSASPVRDPETALAHVLADDINSIEILACVSSCSFGPITAICDGTTK